VVGRVGRHDAGGDDEVDAPLLQRLPVLVQTGDQLAEGEHGVVPQPARHRARMPGGADDAVLRVAPVAADAGDRGGGKAAGDHHRPLLDVHLEEGAELGRVPQALAPGDGFDVGTDRLEAGPERAARGPVAALQVTRRQPAPERQGADIGAVEPGTFLAAEHDQFQRDGRQRAGAAVAGEDEEPRGDARGAVEVAALGHAVEVRADRERRAVHAAVEPGRQVARAVRGHAEVEARGQLADEVERRLLARAEGFAGDADRVLADRGERGEVRVEEAGLVAGEQRAHQAGRGFRAVHPHLPGAPTAGGQSRSVAAPDGQANAVGVGGPCPAQALPRRPAGLRGPGLTGEYACTTPSCRNPTRPWPT
jgi:hypothetical protein